MSYRQRILPGTLVGMQRWDVSRAAPTLLVENHDVATSEVDGVCSAQAGHCIMRMVSNAWSGDGFKVDSHPPPTTMTLGAILTVFVRQW